MRMKVKDIFESFRVAQYENDNKLKQAAQQGLSESEEVGKIVVRINCLAELLSSCVVDIEIPPHIEDIIGG